MLRACTKQIISPMFRGQITSLLQASPLLKTAPLATNLRFSSDKHSVFKNCPPVRVFKEVKAPNPRVFCARSTKGGKDKKEEKTPKEGCIGAKTKKKKGPHFVSMWYNPKCCINPCADIPLRYDDTHYKPTDKGKRKYTRTWKECKSPLMRYKKTCCLSKIKPPQLPKRKPRKAKPKTASGKDDANLMSCGQGASNDKCPKFVLPRCKNVRKPPRCHIKRKPTICKKICAPYPSFSECKRPPARKARRVECKCLKIPPPRVCTVFDELRKILMGPSPATKVKCRPKK